MKESGLIFFISFWNVLKMLRRFLKDYEKFSLHLQKACTYFLVQFLPLRNATLQRTFLRLC